MLLIEFRLTCDITDHMDHLVFFFVGSIYTD